MSQTVLHFLKPGSKHRTLHVLFRLSFLKSKTVPSSFSERCEKGQSSHLTGGPRAQLGLLSAEPRPPRPPRAGTDAQCGRGLPGLALYSRLSHGFCPLPASSSWLFSVLFHVPLFLLFFLRYFLSSFIMTKSFKVCLSFFFLILGSRHVNLHLHVCPVLSFEFLIWISFISVIIYSHLIHDSLLCSRILLVFVF